MLCNICSDFDISALFAQSKSQPPQQDKTGTYYPEIPLWFKHQTRITAIKSGAADGCELCELLWSQCQKRFNDADIDNLESHGEGEEQIYLGLSLWRPERKLQPFITIEQHNMKKTPTLCKLIGWLEPYAKRGKIGNRG